MELSITNTTASYYSFSDFITTTNMDYNITIPTTITVSGSWSNWTTDTCFISPHPTYGKWVPSSMRFEEYIPDSNIPIFGKKEIYIVREEHAHPYELYDWIKLNMLEREGRIIRDFVSGSWV